MNRPFKITVKSDGVEYMFPSATGEGQLANNRGFSLGRFNIATIVNIPVLYNGICVTLVYISIIMYQ